MSKYIFSEDIPNQAKPKNIIFYPQGLKIYGALPFILNRKLKAEFCGFDIKFSGDEPNFTIIQYSQEPDKIQALVDWLYSDARFMWAIAYDGEKLRKSPGSPPACYLPKHSFPEQIKKSFGYFPSHPEKNVAQPWDAILGGEGEKPKPWDAVLGGQIAQRLR